MNSDDRLFPLDIFSVVEVSAEEKGLLKGGLQGAAVRMMDSIAASSCRSLELLPSDLLRTIFAMLRLSSLLHISAGTRSSAIYD